MLPSHGSVQMEIRLLLMTFIQIVRATTPGPIVMNKMDVGIQDSSGKFGRIRIELLTIITTIFAAEKQMVSPSKAPCLL